MQQAQSRRLALFLAVSAAIIAAALLFALHGGNPTPLPGAATGRNGAAAAKVEFPRATATAARALRLRGEVRASARLFLPAFFRYEVGELTPGVERALHSSATPRFAARLLAAAPRAPASGEFPPPAKLGRIEIAFVSILPPRAVVSGAARRGASSEQFSFVFERRGGAWRASGPGQ